LEDKILQRALVEVLNAIYETDFLGFSYGFRSGRSPHHALDALVAGIVGKKVNWVLDADFSEYFSSSKLRHRIRPWEPSCCRRRPSGQARRSVR